MNTDYAYCAARDCRHNDDCKRRIPDDVPIDDWHIPPKTRRTFSATT